MSVPNDFRLDPMSGQDGPPPKPPRYLKTQIYTNVKVFKPIDDHAVNVSTGLVLLLVVSSSLYVSHLFVARVLSIYSRTYMRHVFACV